MDKLQVLVKSFSKEEVNGFEHFINRFRIRNNRKDIELFKLLWEHDNVTLEFALEKMYGGKNEKEAYHALRKRLLGYLIEYVSLKQYNERKGSQHYTAEGLFTLSKYFFDLKEQHPAWFYLSRSISAEENKANPLLLADMYLLWLENWDSYQGKEKFDVVYKKYIEARDLKQQEIQLKLAVSIIQRKIEQYKLRGIDKGIEEVIKEVIKGFEISKSFIRTPHRLFLFVSIIRSEAIVNRDYKGFESFISSQLKKLEKEEWPDAELLYIAELYYFAAHANYKVKNFTKTEKFIAKYEKLRAKLTKTQNSIVYPKIALLNWAVSFYTGNLMGAIEVLNNLAISEDVQIDIYYELDLKLNLATSYFALENFPKAMEVINSIQHSLTFLQKKKGLEWRFRFQLIELLIHFEQQNYELVDSKLKGLLRKKNSLNKHSQFKNFNLYLDLLKENVFNPHFKDFTKELKSFSFRDFKEENIQEVAFYSFLKSKISEENFYKTLLGTIEENSQ